MVANTKLQGGRRAPKRRNTSGPAAAASRRNARSADGRAPVSTKESALSAQDHHQALFQLCVGHHVAQSISVATRLAIPQALAKSPATAATLATRVKAHPDRLYRLLRLLASVGLFSEDRMGRFRLTPFGRLLTPDHPQSLYELAYSIGMDWHWQSSGALIHGIVSDQIPFDRVFGMPIFEYLQKNPELEQAFGRIMRNMSSIQVPAVAAAYAFGEFNRLVDVGGGHGHLLAAILKKNRKLEGILYDQPQVVDVAEASGLLSEFSPRAQFARGDFFDNVPEGANGYILKYIIHDWSDRKSIQILSNCRKAMAKGGRVLIVESIIAPGNAADPVKIMDIAMLLTQDGQERSKAEYRALLEAAGLKIKRIVPTKAGLSIIEAVAA